MNINTLKKFEGDIRSSVPDFSVKWKDSSRAQRVLGTSMFFNRKYMTGYVTTFYPRVYFPSEKSYEKNPASSFIVLAHERVHLMDAALYKWWFRLSYLLPQILVLPALLASLLCLVVKYYAFSLVFFGLGVVAALPWASPFRVQWEKRGYAMTMAANYWLYGSIPDKMKQEIRSNFLGWSYYKMSRDPADIDAWIAKTVADIEGGRICTDPVYDEVHRFLLAEGLTHQ